MNTDPCGGPDNENDGCGVIFSQTPTELWPMEPTVHCAKAGLSAEAKMELTVTNSLYNALLMLNG